MQYNDQTKMELWFDGHHLRDIPGYFDFIPKIGDEVAFFSEGKHYKVVASCADIERNAWRLYVTETR